MFSERTVKCIYTKVLKLESTALKHEGGIRVNGSLVPNIWCIILLKLIADQYILNNF